MLKHLFSHCHRCFLRFVGFRGDQLLAQLVMPGDLEVLFFDVTVQEIDEYRRDRESLVGQFDFDALAGLVRPRLITGRRLLDKRAIL
ncbi:MAG: hypothetical protein HYX46_08450 [Betaproteobacteria bacterium]|nr:hypothetical protein [Betaproteobacteria bacterium]